MIFISLFKQILFLIDFNIHDFIMDFKQNTKGERKKNFKHFLYSLHYYSNIFPNKNGVKKVYD